jgi:hypothetical protein
MSESPRRQQIRKLDDIAFDVAVAVVRLRNVAGHEIAIQTLECLAETLREEKAAKSSVLH